MGFIPGLAYHLLYKIVTSYGYEKWRYTMKKRAASVVTLVIFSLFAGFSSIAIAETSKPASSDKDLMVFTLPEIVCKVEKMQKKPEINIKEYLKEEMASIREKFERIELKRFAEEISAIIQRQIK